MVLMAMGLEIGEAELRERCDCTVFGTDALMAVDAVRALGFGRTRKETSTIAGLMDALALGIYPIVFLNVLPIDGVKGAHAMVLVELEDDCDFGGGVGFLLRSIAPLSSDRYCHRPLPPFYTNRQTYITHSYPASSCVG
jgi:hypothetical protein